MPKTRPFTRKSLLEYPQFVQLTPEIQTYALSLFDNDKLNSTGNFKRAPNAFIMFRRTRSAQIIAEHKVANSSDSSKGVPQKEVSLQVTAEWDQMSAAQKVPYELEADHAKDALYGQFQHYEYHPLQDLWWGVLTKDGKKRYFFESMVQICNTVVNNVPWSTYPTIQVWSQLPAHLEAGYVDAKKLSKVRSSVDQPVATARRAIRGSGSESIPQTAPAPLHQVASHPYEAACMARRPRKDTVSWIDKLKSELIHLGPRAPGGPERMLELITPRPQEAPVPVYIEVEIPPQVPQNIVQTMKMNEHLIPNDALVLWDYTKPRHVGTTSPHTESDPPVPPKLAISQVPRLPPSLSTPSPASSCSGVISSRSPTTPVQYTPSNDMLGANHSNHVSGNLDTYAKNPSSSLPTMTQLAQLLYGQTPTMNPYPTNVPFAAYTPVISLETLHQNEPPTSLIAGSSTETFDAYSTEFQLDVNDFSWLFDRGTTQNDSNLGTLDLQSIMPNDTSYLMSAEEIKLALEDFDRTFQEIEALGPIPS